MEYLVEVDTSVPSGAAMNAYLLYSDPDSMGTSADFGDTNKAAAWGQGGCSSSTRGVFTGGTNSPTNLNDIRLYNDCNTHQMQ